MSRKRCHRRVIVPQAPRGLRPKFSRAVLTTIGLAHMENLDEIARGRADEQTLWHLVESVFTWHRVAQVLALGEPEMMAQLDLATRVVERYRDRGVIAFTGVEYQVAKLGIQVMDALAEQVDEPTAKAAAVWSSTQLGKLVAQERGRPTALA